MKNFFCKFNSVAIDFLEFALILVVILDLNTVYSECIFNSKLPTLSHIHLYMKFWTIGIGLLLLGLYIIKNKANIQILKNYKTMFIINAVFVLLFSAINVVNVAGEGYFAAFFFIMSEMTLIFKMHNNEGHPYKLFYLIENIMLFLIISSVALWFWFTIIKLCGFSDDVKVLWGGTYFDTNYLNISFKRPMTSDLMKNLCIFTEPPMFGLFINIGLFTELFLKKTNIVKVIALGLGLISCGATLAFMVAVMALFLKFCSMIEGKKYAKPVIGTLLIFAAACVCGLFFYKRNIGYGSFATHLDDFAATVKCFIHNNILWGVGYDYEPPIVEYMSEWRITNPGLSNSIGTVLAEGGIMLFTYYLLPFVALAIRFFKGNKKLAYFGIGMFALYAVVIFHTRVLIFFLMAFGYSMVDIRIKKNKPFITIRLEDIKCVDKKENNEEIKSDNKSSDAPGNVRNTVNVFEKIRTGINGIPGSVINLLSIAGAILCLTELVNYNHESVAKSIVYCALMVINISIYFLNIMRNYEYISWVKNIRYEILFAATVLGDTVFIAVGSFYTAAEHFLKDYNLLLQESHWNFVILILAIYLICLIYDKIICGVKRH